MASVPLSFEFYPPKTDDQAAQLDRTLGKLKAWGFKTTPESCRVISGQGLLDAYA